MISSKDDEQRKRDDGTEHQPADQKQHVPRVVPTAYRQNEAHDSQGGLEPRATAVARGKLSEGKRRTAGKTCRVLNRGNIQRGASKQPATQHRESRNDHIASCVDTNVAA